jgi:hypothetical protein
LAQKSRAKFEKRQKELARQDRQKLKRARRAEARAGKPEDAPETPGDTDLDAAGDEADPTPPPDET